jgi:hypothetical protein
MAPIYTAGRISPVIGFNAWRFPPEITGRKYTTRLDGSYFELSKFDIMPRVSWNGATKEMRSP